MAKFIITYDYGYGENYEIVEAPTMEDAENMAYEAWNEGAQNHAGYCAEEYTKEAAINYSLEDEDEDG